MQNRIRMTQLTTIRKNRLHKFAANMQTFRVLDFMFDGVELKAQKLTKHGKKHGKKGLNRFHYCRQKVEKKYPMSQRDVAEASIAIYLHDVGRIFGSRPHYVMGALLVFLMLLFYGVPLASCYRIAYAIRYHAPEHIMNGKLKLNIQAWLILIDKSLDGVKRLRKEEAAVIELMLREGRIRDYCGCPVDGPHILRGKGIGNLGDHAHHHLVNGALCEPQPEYQFEDDADLGLIAELLMGANIDVADRELIFALFGPRFLAVLNCFAFLGIPANIVLVIGGVREHYHPNDGGEWRCVRKDETYARQC